MDTPSPQLMSEISKDFEQIRARRRWRLGLFCLITLAGTLSLSLRAPSTPDPRPWLFWAALAALASGGGVLCALAFGWRLPTRRHLRPLPWAGLALGLTVLALSIRGGESDAPFLRGAVCLGTGLGGVAVLLVLALALGGGIMRHHGPTGLLLGVGVGLLGIVPLHLACAHASADHLMVWHALVPILGGLLGTLSWFLMAERR